MRQIHEDRRSGNYPSRDTYFLCDSIEEYESKWQDISKHYKVWASRDTAIHSTTSILQLDGFNEVGGQTFTAQGISVCLQEGSYTITVHYIKPNTIQYP